MITMTLLSITALLKAVFAALAVAVVGRCGYAREATEMQWVWLSAAFAVSAASGLFQAVWAAFAFAAGPGGAVYESYLAWLPAMNYSRYGVMIALGVCLSVLPFLPFRPAFASFSWPIFISGAMLLPGIVAGYTEGAYAPGLHPSRLSVLQVVETFALLSALFVAVVRRTMDTWLWLILFLYAVRQAVNALLWAAYAWRALPDGWQTPNWLDPAVGIVVWSTMIALAEHRRRLARRGSSAPIIFALGGDEANVRGSTGIDVSSR